MKKIFTLFFLASVSAASAQQATQLTVEKIMRDPKWMGTSPSAIHWSNDSRKVYFMWNPEAADHDALYSITPNNLTPEKVSLDERRTMPANMGVWNKKHTLRLYEKNGDLFIWQAKADREEQLTNTVERESNPVFNATETEVLFLRNDNLYAVSLKNGAMSQLTNFIRTAGAATGTPASVMGQGGRRGGGMGMAGGRTGGNTQDGNQQERWLKAEQLELFDVIRKKDKDSKAEAAERKELQPKKLREIAIGEQSVSYLELSPDEQYITYRLIKAADGAKITEVPNYVTASGFTEDIPNRTKVGAPQSTSVSYIFDTKRDTVYAINTSDIPGIKDIPEYVKDYPQELARWQRLNEDRKVVIHGPLWSEDGKNAVVVISAQDNKDRWVMKLNPATGKLTLLDRQHDEAWIGGPGIGGGYSTGNVGWIDNERFYFQSEATGYSHIYVVNVATGARQQLTTGKWEVQSLQLSNDKKNFYFTANMENPGITHFYRLPVSGGTPVKLTSVKGFNETELSPDEKWLAIRYSYTNKPWELYIQPNKPGAKAIQVTHSTTAEFNAYPWRDPQIITFKNRYGADVYARIYVPANPHPSRPAVIFVHGAGYLQNVGNFWSSSYFHEYLFNNLLTDNGYTVLDIDYTGSAGYGRDWRTGIYRHMGGKDLDDQVDGARLLVEKYGVNPKHIGIYGGSYGGFMTLMAMFTQPDVFAAGGALRSVTDWAHYNHGYTSDILNEPYNDEKAYHQSSPIYFADGLKGRLLMCHGMVDQNVNYQDIVRLEQRLIELHKENWQLASYPVEDHGFVQPSSWTDEYKRIFKLFEETLK